MDKGLPDTVFGFNFSFPFPKNSKTTTPACTLQELQKKHKNYEMNISFQVTSE